MKKILFVIVICFISCTTNQKVVKNEAHGKNSLLQYTKKLVFKSGTDELIGDYMKDIDIISDIIKKLPKKDSFEISGHTDTVGDKNLNLALSQKRAEKIKKLLVAKGCKPLRLIAKGYGETRPLVSNKTKAGRKQNRRIEINIIEL